MPKDFKLNQHISKYLKEFSLGKFLKLYYESTMDERMKG
jgi:hypothetical protein